MTFYIIQKVYDNYSGDIKTPIHIGTDEVATKTLFVKLQETFNKIAEAEARKYDNMPSNVQAVNDMLLRGENITEEQHIILDQFYKMRQKEFKEFAIQLGVNADVYPSYKIELETLENTSLEAMLQAL